MITSTRYTVTTGKLLTISTLLLAAIAASLLLAARPTYASTTFTVINTDDSGAGSLRQAITDASATAGADVINFNIPGSGVRTIAPTTELPTITEAVTINGYSQPGAQPNTLATGATNAVLKIELNGQSVEASGLEIRGPNSVVRGLVVNRFADDGIFIEGPGNKVEGNYIGTDPSGTLDLGNVRNGVKQGGGNSNTVGGSSPSARNLISGNDADGVQLDNGEGGNQVLGNLIGTKKGGVGPLGNSGSGVVIDTPNNTVGGTTAGARNIISGNDGNGVYIRAAEATGNRIVGNYVGTDASGTLDLGNRRDGVSISGANNTVGGATAAERNVISGNNGEGVAINGTAAKGNRVVGNFIGTDKDGTADLGNSLDGVFIYEASNNAIGGTQAGERNVILGNGYDGVAIYSNGATGNRLLSNSISSNDEQGIDLNADGPTANDLGDADAGPNNFQNFPVLASARKGAAGVTTIRGTLATTANGTFRVQFFANPEGTDEGKTLLGSTTVSTSGTGDASFSFSTKKPVRLGQDITATATGPGGNTSEFSAPRRMVAQ